MDTKKIKKASNRKMIKMKGNLIIKFLNGTYRWQTKGIFSFMFNN